MAIALVVSVVLVTPQARIIRVTASSGSTPWALLEGDSGAVAWYTDAETVGAWVEVEFSQPVQVGHVHVMGPGPDATSFTSAVLTFDGGASLMLTADVGGDAAVTFPARTVSRVRVTIAEVPQGATSVALGGLSLDSSGDAPAEKGDSGDPVVASTSSSTGVPASVLSDGTPAEGDTGAEWTAAQDDPAPWAELGWERPREVASVQAFGPTSRAGDGPTEPLRGLLRFDDGSTVLVAAIARDGAEATTIAFAPRMATSVRLEIDRTAGRASVGLRAFTVHDVGTTPPRWPQDGDRYATSPPLAEPCGALSTPVAQPRPGELTLVCPSPGSAVTGKATIVVAADPQVPVQALVWAGSSRDGARSVDVVASATAGPNRRAVLPVETSDLPRGPLTLRVEARGEDPGDPLYVQLLNPQGRPREATGSAAPEGMTLQWAEEFTDPLSVSAAGVNADYAAVKPDASSSGQFGEALFIDPAAGAETLTTVDGDYLRIRARRADDADTGRYLAGLLASADAGDAGGAGFAAQYGYFEARILGAPGTGAWSAFWLLNTESAARLGDTAAEVDIVELYGHNTLGSCHTRHSWGASDPEEPGDSEPHCQDRHDFADWALAWHTYGVRVTPNSATFSIDGVVVSTLTDLSHTPEPFFFLIDLALGGGWPVDLGPTGGTTDMYVDWVRVYT